MNYFGRLTRALRTEGVKSASWRAAKWVSTRRGPFRVQPLSSVYYEDVIAADWSKPRDFNSHVVPQPPDGYKVAWVISPPSATSGGHQNAFRFMSFLEAAGHELTVYLYSAPRFPVVNADSIVEMMAGSNGYPTLKAEFRVYDPEVGITGDPDAIFASDWEAAYAVYRYPNVAKRFYFTQDFEPAFFPAGSDYVVAENSYRLGFHGFSAGRWLAQKLEADFGMSCDYYDFATDITHYSRINTKPRNEVVFYARPPTPRRATEFGLLALLELHRLRPDVTINLVGWDMSTYDVPFPYVNHAAVDISKLNAIYNRCAAGLVLSLTNMSLVPMEVMASGVVPVVNDAPNTRGVFDSEHIEYVPMSPRAIAERMIAILDRPDQAEHSAVIADSLEGVEWEDEGAVFTQTFVRAMTTSL